MSVQDPLQIQPRNQPQPDVMVLQSRADCYAEAHPTASDVFLLIEVADSSVEYDLETKAAIYAQAGIADYWVVNLVDTRLVVLRQLVDGSYRSLQTLSREDSISPLAFPDLTLAVA